MNNTANNVSADVSTRPATHLRPSYKQRIKNLLFPIPGVRKLLIRLRQGIDNTLFRLRKSAPGPLFQNRVNPGLPRAIVISIPKSGTYLMHELLKALGLVASGVHLGESGYYDQSSESAARAFFGETKIDSPLIATVERIGAGQVTAGHLLYLPENVKALRDFRTFFCYRESRAVFVSLMRYFFNPGLGEEFGTAWKRETSEQKRMESFLRLYAPATIQSHKAIAGWITNHSTLPVRYETLSGDDGGVAQTALVKRIAGHVGITLDDAAALALITKVTQGGSRTWSGKRSDVNQYWSEPAEAVFQKNGGQQLNQRLGYP